MNRSHRKVAASLNISIGGVSKIFGKADEVARARPPEGLEATAGPPHSRR